MSKRIVPALCCAAFLTAMLARTSDAEEKSPQPDILDRFPAPGQLIDVGGRKLHLHCSGDAAASGARPTVIIETGAAASSVFYWKVQDGIAAFAHVCTYDRAGLGWSDPAPTGRTMQDRAVDLHSLLTKARIKPPYVLVGHSMGGLLIRLFARDHRDEVAAMVLVDSSEESYNIANSQANAQTAMQLGMLVEAANRLAPADFSKLVASRLPLPPSAPPEAAITQRVGALRAGKDDLDSFQLSLPQMRQPGGFGKLGDIPLVVIRRGKMSEPPTPRDLAWRESQQRLLQLSTNSTEIVAGNSGHNINLEEPQVIVDAVRRVHTVARDAIRSFQ